MGTTHTTEETKLIASVKAAAARLRKAAEKVETDADMTKFCARLSTWQCRKAWPVSALLGQPEWDADVARELKAVATAALETAAAERRAAREWEIERTELRIRDESRPVLDAATRQYQADLKVMLAGSR